MTSTPLRPFLKTFIIIDEEDEEIHDQNMAQTVDYKNYGRNGMPIRTQFTQCLYIYIIYD